MNVEAAKLFSDGYLQGFFGTVGLMLSSTPTFEVGDVDDLSPDAWPDLVSKYGAVMTASAKEGGAIVVLFPAADVHTVAALFEGQEPPEPAPLTEDELPGLLEIFESCLGGGVAYFKEQYERVVELENIQVRILSLETMEAVTDLLGDDVSSASFTYKVADAIDSAAALLFSTSLEDVIPESATGGGIAQGEVEDILGDFGKEAPPAAAPPAAAAPLQPSAPMPGNIDRVLDIQLTATARLGRVEMPISDILALGPGSIIEVGHLVDEPIELLVNEKLIARGDVVVVDEKFGLRITEIVSAQERIESLG